MGSRRKRSGAFERGGLVPLRQVRAYRVNFRDGNETTAYYTDDLEDAVSAAVETCPRLIQDKLPPRDGAARANERYQRRVAA